MQLLLISLQWQLFELLKVQSSNKLQKTESSREETKSIREELENRQQSMFGRKPVAADVIGISLFRSQFSLFSISYRYSHRLLHSLTLLLLHRLTLHSSVYVIHSSLRLTTRYCFLSAKG